LHVRILAVDTATALCGVAVLDVTDDGNERAAVRKQRVTTHSEMLLPLIAECLDELSLRATELTAVACGAGPGSFTGLRIGLATAKGFCFALELPLAMVSSLEALAERGLFAQAGPSNQAPQPVLAVLDAFRGQIFARLVVPDAARTPQVLAALDRTPQLLRDAVYTPDALAAAVADVDFLLVGRDGPWGGRREGDELSPHPLDVARLGAQALATGRGALLASAVPNYLCVSAAEEALAAGKVP
jgi:tRNA threonylcarbamoyladenosine biosynthesis protein TsaB